MTRYRYTKQNFFNGHFVGDLSPTERIKRINELKNLPPDEQEMADKLGDVNTLWEGWGSTAYKARLTNGLKHFSLFFNEERRKVLGIDDQTSLGEEPLFANSSDEEDESESESEEEPAPEIVQSNTGKKRAHQSQDGPNNKKKAKLLLKMDGFVYDKESLDCHFDFQHPDGKEIWEGLKDRPKLNYNGHNYKVGDIAVIHYQNKLLEEEDSKKAKAEGEHRDPENFWLGQILAFKKVAKDEIIALIAWLYWPEDLEKAVEKDQKTAKGGRRGYHGEFELIASNHLQVVSSRSFNGNFSKYIIKLDEYADGKMATQYYYRQSFDIRTRMLSELRRYCNCDKYQHPGSILLQCPNKKCALWHHQECIVNKYCMDAYLAKQDKLKKKKPSKIYRPKSLDPNSVANAVGPTQRLWKKGFRAEIKKDFKTIVVEDLDPLNRGFFEPEIIKCLKCKAEFT